MGWVLDNIPSSNIFQIMLLSERYHQICQTVLAAVGINGLTQACLGIPHENVEEWK